MKQKYRLLDKIKKEKEAYLMLLPAVAGFTLFLIYPLIKAFYLSLYSYDLKELLFVGIDNYLILVKDPIFKKSLLNTIYFAVGIVSITIVFSFLAASVISNMKHMARSFCRGAFYLPVVTSVVSLSLLWKWMYDPAYGLISHILNLIFGMEMVNLLGNKYTALPALIFVIFTMSVGAPIILYSAAMGAIPITYYEVADIDGAKKWHRIFYITLPLVKPTTLYLVVILTISSFQTFEVIQLMTGGGPYYSTSTIAFQLYETAFNFNQFGLASAMGIVLLGIVALFSGLQFRFFSSNVEY